MNTYPAWVSKHDLDHGKKPHSFNDSEAGRMALSYS